MTRLRNHESRSINLNDYKYSSEAARRQVHAAISRLQRRPLADETGLTYNLPHLGTRRRVVERATLSSRVPPSTWISDESPLAGFTVNDPNSSRSHSTDVIVTTPTVSDGRYHYTATVDMSRVSGGSSSKPYVLCVGLASNPQSHHDQAATGNGGGSDGGSTGDQPGNGGGI